MAWGPYDLYIIIGVIVGCLLFRVYKTIKFWNNEAARFKAIEAEVATYGTLLPKYAKCLHHTEVYTRIGTLQETILIGRKCRAEEDLGALDVAITRCLKVDGCLPILAIQVLNYIDYMPPVAIRMANQILSEWPEEQRPVRWMEIHYRLTTKEQIECAAKTLCGIANTILDIPIERKWPYLERNERYSYLKKHPEDAERLKRIKRIKFH